jgi:hypothetical protein
MRSIRPVLCVALLLAACATPVPATVTWGPSMPITEDPSVFVMTNEQRPRIEQSLRDAGMIVVGSSGDANYRLEVAVGSSRGSQPCGKTANVRYILSRLGSRVLVIKGRGRTGACAPNVFEDMSRLLESYVQHRATGTTPAGVYAVLPRASDVPMERASR